MQRWVVICWALLALVAADECPDGGSCEEGQTCCNNPSKGYECCPLDKGECCADHIHCCPTDTLCNVQSSSCENATVALPWVERTPAQKHTSSKSFRMIKSHMGEDDDNICPDQSRCPAEFSCLKALTKYGCCPLPQGVSCSDGKHCCPEGHQCSMDSRSCMKKELLTTVLCNDGVSECPDDTTCCETPEGTWGCCPLPKAVCCEDKKSCCPEGTTCDVAHLKCISLSTKKELPMWAKFPARIRADWENQKVGRNVTAKAVEDNETPQVTTANSVTPAKTEVSVSSVTEAAGVNSVPCNDSVACPDNTTCCKSPTGDWECCPLPEAVCCEDLIHCCPKGKKCNLAQQTCDDSTCSVPWKDKLPAIPRRSVEMREKNVTCDQTTSCPDGSTCCKTKDGAWACCPLPEAVCCDDHEHCCPSGTTCDLTTSTCNAHSGSTPMKQKIPANTSPSPTTTPIPVTSTTTTTTPSPVTSTTTTTTPSPVTSTTTTTTPSPVTSTTTTTTPSPVTSTTVAAFPEEKTMQGAADRDGGGVKCDSQTSCPRYSTCCIIASTKKWGCCPLPEAVCCADGSHCCPSLYKCEEGRASCIKEEVVIPWYTKIPAITSVEAEPSPVLDDGAALCPEHSSCCKLFTGELGCCPMENAVCCPDMEHCCPQGYTCDIATKSCHKLIKLQLETVPLTPVYLPEYQQQGPPEQQKDVQCDQQFSCKDQETCCRTSPTTWGCCPAPNAVCCSDMQHCCPSGYTCTAEGACVQNRGLHWHSWNVFLPYKKKALNV
ncbi:granulin a [Xenentodon cancila]